MHALLHAVRSIFSSKSTKPKRAHLNVENLDARLVPSASSYNLHAVDQTNGASVAFFRSPTNNAFYEKSASGYLVELATPGKVSDFSAGRDRSGNADVFVHEGSAFLEYNSTGWHNLIEPRGMPRSIQHFAAVDGGRVYAVASDHSMWEYTTPYTHPIWEFNPVTHARHLVSVTTGGWTEVASKNTAWAVDAVTQASGIDAVFVVRSDNSLEEYSAGNWKYLASGSQRGSFSAGLDTHGNADVFMQATGGNLERWTASTGWQVWERGGDGLETMSAGRNGQLYDEPSDGSHLWVLDETHHDGPQVPGSQGLTYDDLSTAGANDVFVMTTNGWLMEYTPHGAWIPWKI